MTKVSKTSRKRKAASNGGADNSPRKKSPLADQPQNYYAPNEPMTREQLSEWRKEQRKERNRQSAAASRNKTRERIEELEGEISHWRDLCDDLQVRMAGMQRQIEFLTKLHHPQAGAVQLEGLQPVSPSASVSNSPGISPRTSPAPVSSYVTPLPQRHQLRAAIPSAHVDHYPQPTITPPISPAPSIQNETRLSSPSSHPNLFPPLLSNFRDIVPIEKNGLGSVHAPDNSKTHLIQPISRQA